MDVYSMTFLPLIVNCWDQGVSSARWHPLTTCLAALLPLGHVQVCNLQPNTDPSKPMPGLYEHHQGSLSAAESIVNFRDIFTLYPTLTQYYDSNNKASYAFDPVTGVFVRCGFAKLQFWDLIHPGD